MGQPGFPEFLSNSLADGAVSQSKVFRIERPSESKVSRIEGPSESKVFRIERPSVLRSSVEVSNTSGDLEEFLVNERYSKAPQWMLNFVILPMEKMLVSFANVSLSKEELDTEMRFIPLNFVDPYNERRYMEKCKGAFPTILRIFCILGILCLLFLWLLVGLHLAVFEPEILTSEESVNIFLSWFPLATYPGLIVFHVCCAITFCSLCFLSTIGEIKYLRNCPEVVAYIVLLFVTTCWAGWDLVMTFTVSLDLSSPTYLASAQALTSYKLWSDTFSQWMFVMPLIMVDFFLPSRTRISFVYHLLSVPLSSSGFISSAAHFHAIRHLAVLGVLQTIMFLAFAFVCFMGGYTKELVSRLDFLQLVVNEGQLRMLEEQAASNQSGPVKTDAEQLNNLLTEAGTSLRMARIKKSTAYFDISQKLLDKCRCLIMTSPDLYAVHFEDEVNIQAARDWGELYGRRRGSHLPIKSGSSTAAPYKPTEARRLSTGVLTTSRKLQVSLEENPVSSPEIETIDPTFVSKVEMKVAGLTPSSKALQAQLAMKIGRSLEFDILKFARQPNVLLEVGFCLLCPILSELDIHGGVLRNFLSTIEDLYRDNPYHNSIHGAQVAHYTIALCFRGKGAATKLNTADYASVVVAALGHDVGHPGRSNHFLGQCRDPLAVVYNDSSVLENYHSCLIFKTLSRSNCDIFRALDFTLMLEVRQHIIDLVLSTDMRYHFETISRFRLRLTSEDFDPIHKQEDIWATIKMCMKAADLSHAVLPWQGHYLWSIKIAEEFYQQGEEEVSLGFEPSPPCDRANHRNFAANQKTFLLLFVKPLFEELAEVHGMGVQWDYCMRNLEANASKWQSITDRNEVVEVPVADKDEEKIEFDIVGLLCFDFDYLMRTNRVKSKKTTTGDLIPKDRCIMKRRSLIRRFSNEKSKRFGAEPLSSFIHFSQTSNGGGRRSSLQQGGGRKNIQNLTLARRYSTRQMFRPPFPV